MGMTRENCVMLGHRLERDDPALVAEAPEQQPVTADVTADVDSAVDRCHCE
jgi:hypothetical protein